MKRMLIYLLCSLLPAFAGAKSLRIEGLVTDAFDLSPLSGVSVAVQNAARSGATDRSASTDRQGRYTIKAGPQDTLVFRLDGYQPLAVPVEGHRRIDVALDRIEECFEESDIAVCGEPIMHFATAASPSVAPFRQSQNSEEYAHFAENRFRSALDEPLSTFALEADGASYANCRRMIRAGQLPPQDAVRVEEFINYFPYDYAAPDDDRPLSLAAEAGPCPWNAAHRLVRIALKARETDAAGAAPAHMVYLVDVSGSMYCALPLVKASMKMLTDNLRPCDTVSIVTYASGVGIRLEAAAGSDRRRIRDVIDGLVAEGATSGGAGLQLAYEVARRHFIPGGNNRIVLCTDGDFNVGQSSDEDIEALIVSRRKESGVQLSVLGYGMGNYKDKKMQIIAEKGNGNYAYIDDMTEASRVMFREFGSAFATAAKDVKMQVEFNPARVASYRLVGYESRLLEAEDFNDDRKDAGEIGPGHTVTALYEIIPAGTEEHPAGTVDALRYQSRRGTPVVTIPSAELLNVKVRYKLPDVDRSRLLELPLKDDGAEELSGDFAFAAAVAMYAQLLRGSDFSGDATCDAVVALAAKGLGYDPGGYRQAFIELVRASKYLR